MVAPPGFFKNRSLRCSQCDKEMQGICDFSIRILCRECGGSAIPSGSNDSKRKPNKKRERAA